MVFSRAGWLILTLGLIPGEAAYAGFSNHCEAIRKNEHKCSELEGNKLENVHQICEKLLKKQQEARDLAKSSCGKEAASVTQKSACLSSAHNQKEIDRCNAASDHSMADNAGDAATKHRKLVKEIRKLREKLDGEVKKLKGDPEVDQDKLSKAEDVSSESRDKIESDVTSLADADEQASNGYGGTGDEGNFNSGDLSSDQGPDASGGAIASADAAAGSASDSLSSSSPGFQLGDDSASDSGGTAASADPQSAAIPGLGAGYGSQAPASFPTSVGAQVAAESPTLSSAAAPVTAPAMMAAPAPVSVGTTASGSTGVGERTAGAAPLILGASSAGAPAESAAASAAGGNSMRDELRRRIAAAARGEASSGGYAGQVHSRASEQSGGDSGAGGYSPGRSTASVSAEGAESSEAAGPAPEALEPFSNSLSGSRFSLMGSETDASVKKMVRELGGGEAVAQGSPEEIGERNGPNLFERSHATIERSLRKGRIRGVAMR